MSEHDRHLGAATLKQLRRSRGMSLADTARALIDVATRLGHPLDSSVASVQRAVARWESSRPILPGERYQLLLAHLYSQCPDGETALGAGSDFAELLDALRHLGESERAVDELRRLLVRTSTDAGFDLLALLGSQARTTLTKVLADPGRADETLLEVMSTAVSDVNREVGSLPFARLQLLPGPSSLRRWEQGARVSARDGAFTPHGNDLAAAPEGGLRRGPSPSGAWRASDGDVHW